MNSLKEAIEEMWPTRVWVGTLILDSLNAGLPACIEAEVSQIAKELIPNERLIWNFKEEKYVPGSFVAMRWNEGSVVSITVIESSGQGSNPESGKITLHDPRAGAAAIPVPGRPWGQPANISPSVGTTLVFSSWIAWSLAPLSATHAIRLSIGTAQKQ